MNHFKSLTDLDIETKGSDRWKSDRFNKPEEILLQGAFTDFVIRVENKEYHVHRLILAMHSDYFFCLLSSGMKEASEGQMELHGVKIDTFDIVIEYIYTGSLRPWIPTQELYNVFEAANMLQIPDLEANCASQYLSDLDARNCLEKESRLRKLSVLQGDPDFQEDVFKALKGFIKESVKDRWKDVINSRGFLELEIEALVELLQMKAAEEELSDFSYSFTQTDLLEGVCTWLKHDLEHRKKWIKSHLESFYCLHQIRIGHVKEALRMFGQEKSLEGKEESMDLDNLCHGSICPRRIVKGLMVVFARTPWSESEHLLYYFLVPPWSQSSEKVLEQNVLYHLLHILPGVGENGEMNLITPNNFLALTQLEAQMVLVVDDSGKLSGTLMDGLNETSQCIYHHSEIYHHCPTNFLTCECPENHLSFCSDPVLGYIWIVTSCPVTDVLAKSQRIQYDPCCATYKMIKAPLNTFGSSTVALEDSSLIFLGGYTCQSGHDVNVVSSFQILKRKFGSSHAIVTTETLAYGGLPEANFGLFQYSLETGAWTQWSNSIPFEISDAALILVKHKLYVIGGSRLTRSGEENLHFYFQPQSSVWILDLKKGAWEKGPQIPRSDDEEHGEEKMSLDGYTKGSAYLVNDNVIVFSGGVRLQKNAPHQSNQIYNYISNTKAFYLDLTTNEWRSVIDLSDVSQNFRHFTLYGVVPTRIRLEQLRILRGNFAKMGR